MSPFSSSSSDIYNVQWSFNGSNTWDHENMFETGLVRANGCWLLRQTRRRGRGVFSIVPYDSVLYVLVRTLIKAILMSTHNVPFFNMAKKYTLTFRKFAAIGVFFPRGTGAGSIRPR